MEKEIAQLQKAIEEENKLNKVLREKISNLQKHSFNLQKISEQEEEYIANKLMKKVHDLQEENQIFKRKIETEEEYLKNNLQKKLTNLEKDKIEMEKKLEAEQEYVVNKLQKQLRELSIQKIELEKKISEEKQKKLQILNKNQEKIESEENEKISTEAKRLKMANIDLKKQVEILKLKIFFLSQKKHRFHTKFRELAKMKRFKKPVRKSLPAQKNPKPLATISLSLSSSLPNQLQRKTSTNLLFQKNFVPKKPQNPTILANNPILQKKRSSNSFFLKKIVPVCDQNVQPQDNLSERRTRRRSSSTPYGFSFPSQIRLNNKSNQLKKENAKEIFDMDEDFQDQTQFDFEK